MKNERIHYVALTLNSETIGTYSRLDMSSDNVSHNHDTEIHACKMSLVNFELTKEAEEAACNILNLGKLPDITRTTQPVLYHNDQSVFLMWQHPFGQYSVVLDLRAVVQFMARRKQGTSGGEDIQNLSEVA